MKAVEDDITCSLAGVIAQSMAGFAVSRDAGRSDMNCAVELASRICETEAQKGACIKWLTRRAEIILNDDKYCMCLGNLASVLLEHGRLDYSDVESVFEQSLAQHELMCE